MTVFSPSTSLSATNSQNGITLAFSTEARSKVWNTFSHRKRIISYLTPQDASSFHAIHQAFNRKQSKWPDEEEGQSTRVIVTKDPEKGVEHLRLKGAKEVWNLKDLSLNIFSFLNVKEACRIFQVCRIFSPIRSMYFCRCVEKLDLYNEQDRALHRHLPGIIFNRITRVIDHELHRLSIPDLLKSCPKLQRVALANRGFKEIEVLISHCPSLTSLLLIRCVLYTKSKTLILPENIIHFVVVECAFKNRDFFVRNAHLQAVHLQETDLLPLHGLEKLVKLSHLTLTHNVIQKGMLQKLGQLPSLIHLKIGHNEIDDWGELKELCALQFITVPNSVSEEGLMQLTQISTLKGIELKYDVFDDYPSFQDDMEFTIACKKAGIEFTITSYDETFEDVYALFR